ncbi:MAG: cyclic pyranopterin monophosphate synthase MoaC [Elusimicrobiota bacterium]
MKRKFSHLDAKGRARMVDISLKVLSERIAVAQGEVRARPEIIKLIRDKKIPKGDVLPAAKFAGIMAAKKTGELIPFCHPLLIDLIDLDFRLTKDKIIITSQVKTSAKTGVEMEALTAVAVAGLAIYDMCKSADKGMVISEIKLIKKSGGKSGEYVRRNL